MKLSAFRLGVFLLAIGVASYAYSMTLELFENESEFMTKMDDLSSAENIDIAYDQLRLEYVTNKPLYIDIGIVCLSLGGFILLFLPKGLKSKTPINKHYIFLIGGASVLATCIAYVMQVVSYVSRWVVPPWADSVAIPLASLPIIFLIY